MGVETWLPVLLTPLVGWVVALYFVKATPRRRTVPSTVFWDLVIERVQENALWSRWRGSLLLLLQVLAAAALILALARPFRSGGLVGDVVVVLDSSASMRTRDGSPTRFDAARDEVLRFLDGLGGDVRVALFERGARVRLVAPFESSRATVRAALIDLRATASAGAPTAQVLSAVAGVRTPSLGTLVVVGDDFDGVAAAAALPGIRIDVRSVGRERYNTGLTSLRVAGSAKRATVVVGVTNVAAVPFVGQVELGGLATPVRKADLELAAASDDTVERQVLFTDVTVPVQPELLRVRLVRTTGDADLLADDDAAWAYVRVARTKVVVVSERPATVVLRLLHSLPHLDAVALAPGDLNTRRAELDAAALVVADDTVDPSWLGERNLVLFHPLAPSPVSAGTVISTPRPYAGDATHPVMRYLGLPDLRLERATVLDGAEDGTPLVMCEGGPLVVARTVGTHRQVICGFPLAASNLTYKVGFPVFLTNCLRWILGEDLQLAVSWRVGESPSPVPAGRGVAVFRDPLPEPVRTPAAARELSATGPVDVFTETGVYALGPAAWAEGASWLVPGTPPPGLVCPVNLVSSAETDIRPRITVPPSAPDASAAGGQGRRGGLWRVLVVIALAAAMIEWLVYGRRGG